MDKNTLNWLLNADPWVKYRVKTDLLGKNPASEELVSDWNKVSRHPSIKMMLDDLLAWPGVPLKRHNDASHPVHKLSFIAELGFTNKDEKITEIGSNVAKNISDEGIFQVLMNIPTHFGGSGKDEFQWMICDAPLVGYAMHKMGFESESVIKYLVHNVFDNGWHCCASPKLGKFRGPGKKDDPCPYANLLMLKLLSAIPEYHNSEEVQIGFRTFDTLWKNRKTQKPYLFAMGTDFLKPKAPLVWYDLIHVLDVVSNFSIARNYDFVNDLLPILNNQFDAEERITAKSIFRAWKDWDFGQKKYASPWLTFLAHRIKQRLEV